MPLLWRKEIFITFYLHIPPLFQGIISITEYLFLLCVLTKPRSGFQIAFNMFDMDGNERVDRDEFLVLERIFSTRSLWQNNLEFGRK